MAKLTQLERTQVLLKWRTAAAAAGHPVPDVSVVEAIVAADSVSGAPAGSEWSVLPWVPTINFLLHQLKMSVTDPDLPNELTRPSAAAGSQQAVNAAPPITAMPTTAASTFAQAPASVPTAQPTSPVEPQVSAADRRLEALKRWRGEEELIGRLDAIGSLKDAHIRPISKLTAATEAEIAAMLPASLSGLAGAIASVLAELATETPNATQSAPAAVVEPAMNQQQSVSPSQHSHAVRHEPAAPVPVLASFDGIPATGYAPFAFAAAPEQVGVLRGAYTADGHLVLSWEKVPDAQSTVIYRVVSSDEYAPYNPDQAELIAPTAGLTVTDTRPHRSAARFVQVWAHSGNGVTAAQAAQPVLHAQGTFIAQPFEVYVREDEGRVIGQWQVWPGISRVLVYRIPIERAAQGSGSAEYLILAGDDNLGGFVDLTANRGSQYLYQFWCEADVDNRTQLSAPTNRQVAVSDILEPVNDLTFMAVGDDESPQFDLTWTPPRGGQVFIYRSAQPPRPGSNREPLAESALDQTLLNGEDRLKDPVARIPGGPSSMKNVPWPRDWTRAYFTPVTVLAGQAFVGTTISSARTDSIKFAKIVERVSREVLTFSWPLGAASVLVYIGPTDLPAEVAIRGGQPLSISAEQYKALGGLQFPKMLPSGGCAVHAVPVTFLGGDRIEGTPTTVIYAPLQRIKYDTKLQRSLLGAITGVSVSLISQNDLDRSPSFALIYNAKRFPLSIADGDALTVIEDGMEGVTPGKLIRPRSLLATSPNPLWKTDAESWKNEVGKGEGFVRLFVNEPPERLVSVALLDPPPSQLTLGSRKMGFVGG